MLQNVVAGTLRSLVAPLWQERNIQQKASFSINRKIVG